MGGRGGAVPGIRVRHWVKETIKLLEETIKQHEEEAPTHCSCERGDVGRQILPPLHLEGQPEVLAILVHGGLDRLRGITEGGGAARG